MKWSALLSLSQRVCVCVWVSSATPPRCFLSELQNGRCLYAADKPFPVSQGLGARARMELEAEKRAGGRDNGGAERKKKSTPLILN